jgi:hypothetical protein
MVSKFKVVISNDGRGITYIRSNRRKFLCKKVAPTLLYCIVRNKILIRKILTDDVDHGGAQVSSRLMTKLHNCLVAFGLCRACRCLYVCNLHVCA